MSSQPVCPCCHSPQAVQRVAAIASGGTRQVRIVTADLMPAAGVSRSNLAQLLAPPRQPGGSWLPIIALLGLLILSVPASCMVTGVLRSSSPRLLPVCLGGDRPRVLRL